MNTRIIEGPFIASTENGLGKQEDDKRGWCLMSKIHSKFLRGKAVGLKKLYPLAILMIAATAITACDDSIETKEQVREEAYSYATTDIEDCNLERERVLVKQRGKDGKKEIRERITYSGDEEISRETLSERIISKPVDEVLVYGGREVFLETIEEPIPYQTTRREDASLPLGEIRVISQGTPGRQRVLYEVTYKCGVQAEKKPAASPEIIVEAVDEIIAEHSPAPPNCDPNYEYAACVPIASDVDCAGAIGEEGPFVSGTFDVIGVDIYGLDPDEDGIACN